MLIALLLHHGRLLKEPLLYLSLFFKQHRAEYYDRLDRVRSHGDWEAWVDFFLEGVEQTANGAVNTAQRLVALFQADHQRVQAAGSSSALRVLTALHQRPLSSLKSLATASGLSFPTASKAVLALANLDIVQELTGQRRNRVFAYSAYLAILNEDGEALS